jgi:hypothetical protein
VYRREAIGALGAEGVRSRGYAYQIEMKHRALAAGLTVKECPVIFYGRRSGESKLDWGIVWEALHTVLRVGIQCRTRAFGRALEGLLRGRRPQAKGVPVRARSAPSQDTPLPTEVAPLARLPVARSGGTHAP